MAFDLIVLSLNIYKLIISRRVDGAMGASKLGKLIFADGLIYFMIAYVAIVHSSGVEDNKFLTTHLHF
jgi:hypothetical protein